MGKEGGGVLSPSGFLFGAFFWLLCAGALRVGAVEVFVGQHDGLWRGKVVGVPLGKGGINLCGTKYEPIGSLSTAGSPKV